MLVNVLAFVPRVLVVNRYNGSVLGLFVSTGISTLLMYVFCKTIEKFPGTSIPELLRGTIPEWVRKALMFAFAVIWYTAGMITLLAYSDFTRKFLNPEISSFLVTSIYFLVVGFVATQSSTKILHVLEILLILGVPLTSFILFKAFINKDMNWDSVFAVAAYIRKIPNYESVAAATYVFTGYVNMAVFNRYIPNFKVKWLWVHSVVGLTILFTTLFIPIGFLGADGVSEYTFAWITTADSMRIELGVMERVLFIFLFLYGVIAFASMIIHMHVSFVMLKLMFEVEHKSSKTQQWFAIGVVLLFALLLLSANAVITDANLLTLGKLWLNVRFPAEIVLVAITVFAAWRRRKMS
ncbi:GerAB/ArcD/ProY family transporter [Paenibacillus chartarius]|uniref:GerAB/ArcD/ProY family transporter n=1 Tax=Paenibacillus chartarius TaxID=747481 RepID=A0ABV6DE37_9BACL